MSVFVFAIVKNISNHEKYQEYAKQNLLVIKKYGGKFLYRNGSRELIEGMPIEDRIVIAEFDSIENAKKWYYSKEYTKIKSIRENIAEASIYILDEFEKYQEL